MSDFIMIRNVRCSFPHLFKRPIINGDEGAYGTTLMLDPKEHAKEIAKIEAGIEDLLKEKFKGKKLASDKICLREGNDNIRDEYEGYMTISANAREKPVVLAGNGRDRITDPEDCKIYAGCRVNAKIELWFQNNTWGKRVNATLVAIQFAADDEPLVAHTSVDVAKEGFDAVDEDDLDF